MATAKFLFGGTLTTSLVTLATSSAGVTTIIKEITICNKTASSVTVSIGIGSRFLLYNKPIAANDTIVIALSTVVPTGTAITGSAGTVSAVDIGISGVEV